MFKFRLMTPGPTPVPEETLLSLAKPVPYHRTAEVRMALREVMDGLQFLFQTKNDIVVLTCSGTGAMEAAQISSVPKGKKAIAAFSGRFGERWHKLWQAFGIESIPVTAPLGKAVQAEQIETALQQHPDAEAVSVVHSETSTGVKHDLEAIGKVVAKSKAVLIVDSISGVGTMPCMTDAWGIDLLCTGSQKAFMLPPGLGYISISSKAKAKIEANKDASLYYFDLKKYLSKLSEPDTPFTPAHTLILAQRESIRKLREEGLEAVLKRHARLAEATRAAMRALNLKLFADPPADGLTAVKLPETIDGKLLLTRVEKEYGVKIAGGQDELQGKIFRLAHMGYMDFFDSLAAISAMEMVLHAMGHDFVPGAGITAAQMSFMSSSK